MDKITPPPPEACQRVCEDLVGEAPLAPQTRRHLQHCFSCSATADLLARAPQALALAPAASASPVDARLQQALGRRRRQRWTERIRALAPTPPNIRLVAGAAGVCALLLLAHALQGRPPGALAPAAPTAAAFAADSLASLGPAGLRTPGAAGDGRDAAPAPLEAEGRNDSI